jgi:hypothetical protein
MFRFADDYLEDYLRVATEETAQDAWERFRKSRWPDRNEEWSHHWKEVAISFAAYVAAQPAGTPEQVRELVAKWRQSQAYVTGNYFFGTCADELEAALAATPQGTLGDVAGSTKDKP